MSLNITRNHRIAVHSVVAGNINCSMTNTTTRNLNPNVVSTAKEFIILKYCGIGIATSGVLSKDDAVVVGVNLVSTNIKLRTIGNRHKLDGIAIRLIRTFGTKGRTCNCRFCDCSPSKNRVRTTIRNNIAIFDNKFQIVLFRASK